MELAMTLFGASAVGVVTASFTWECIRIRTGRGIEKIMTPLDDGWFRQMTEWLMTLPEDEREAQLAFMGRGVAQTIRMAMLQMQTTPAA